MVEVRELQGTARPNQDSDHVLIERTPGGKYVAKGSVAGDQVWTFWGPPAYDSLVQALTEAKSWAGQNDVPVIYLMGPDHGDR